MTPVRALECLDKLLDVSLDMAPYEVVVHALKARYELRKRNIADDDNFTAILESVVPPPMAAE